MKNEEEKYPKNIACRVTINNKLGTELTVYLQTNVRIISGNEGNKDMRSDKKISFTIKYIV